MAGTIYTRWQRLTTWVALVLAWAAVAVWQLYVYHHECRLAQRALRRQADALMNAVVGGVQSHRRLGYFFEEQIQGFLSELAKAEDVRAVALASRQGELLIYAPAEESRRLGETAQRAASSPPAGVQESWNAAGFWLVAVFEVQQRAGGLGGGEGLGGRGYGRGPWWQSGPPTAAEGRFARGGQFTAILLLDRGRADDQCYHAAWWCGSVIAAGTLVLVCVGLALRATVRAAEATGRARLLESQARHLRDLGQAAAGLAHETRNPLGLIRGWTQRLVQSGLDSSEQRQQAQAVVEECDRLTARINQFLTFARPAVPEIEAVDPAEVVAELAGLMEPDFDAKGLSLDRSGVRPGQKVQADREMLRQALFNLVQNAVQSSPQGAAVEILMRPGVNGRRRIEVVDRGPGVAPEAVESLFTPYFTTRANGTGLGLAIVRRIATAHGWQAGYAPRAGGGAIFWLDGIHG